MAQKSVHPSHKWDRDQQCKGCLVNMSDPKAAFPCEKPYKPQPRKHGQSWKT
jgi:hypothetical protein